MTNYTKEAQMALAAYMKQHAHFHGPSRSMIDDDESEVNFSLDEASKLIAAARAAKDQYLKSKGTKKREDAITAAQRSAVAQLDDRNADRFLQELNKSEQAWIDDAKAQASRYCQSKNSGGTPKAFDADDANEIDIRNGVLSWIERQKRRGGLGGPKTLKK